jgi:hypothetical protein
MYVTLFTPTLALYNQRWIQELKLGDATDFFLTGSLRAALMPSVGPGKALALIVFEEFLNLKLRTPWSLFCFNTHFHIKIKTIYLSFIIFVFIQVIL